MVSVLRGNKKLISYSISVIKNTLDMYDWIFKASKGLNPKVKLSSVELREFREDYILLLIDYASTLDDLETSIVKIEEVMVKAYFFSKNLDDFETIIKVLYYLELYYKGRDNCRSKALAIQIVFDKLEGNSEDKNRVVESFFSELDRFKGQENEDEVDMHITKQQKLVKLKKVREY